MIVELGFIFLFGLCWGSFLNVIGHRLLTQETLLHARSTCPHCKKIISWYDLFPVVSWIVLRGKCRACSSPISYLYPFIELLTAIVFTVTAYVYFQSPEIYFTLLSEGQVLLHIAGYGIFLSALIVSVRTDLERMVIHRFASLGVIPIGFFLAASEASLISLPQSILAAVIGYLSLWFINEAFYRFTRKTGVGEGDMDLLALIGSFLGVVGIWSTVFFASLAGSVIAIAYLWLTNKPHSTPIPFGPFLALGAWAHIIFYQHILNYLVG